MKTSIAFPLQLLLTGLTVYFTMPTVKKVKAGEPINLGDIGPTLVGLALVLVSGLGGRRRAEDHSE
ncbi:MAG: hypothetical protein JO069_14915 [Verrucomicrobia bacterium]|nr:hypothetical protein [Verrucomicrobiota bacterium]